MDYHFVGHIYRGYMLFEGKVVMDDHFLVIEEYYRPDDNVRPGMYCILISLRTGNRHEVYSGRLKHGPHYHRVT